MDYKTLFSQTPPTRLFFKAAIPGSIGMLASALYQVADGIFISRILGDTAFAGFNLAMPLVIINFALADLIGLGSAVPISIKLGSKDEKEANNYFTCASIMVVLAGILSGAVLALGGRTFLSWMGAQGELLDQATQYLVTYALCSPVTTIVFAVDNYLRICGKIRRSMILNIFMSVACMGFELLFMGVLKIGIRGAALGSSLGMALTAIAAFVPFFLGKMQLRFVRPRFHAKAAGDCLLRPAQLFEQHCRARHLHHYERGAAGHRRAERCVRLRHFDDHGRLCPSSAVRHVRLPPARGGL